jgi:probable HAF family extracellular repeat protein
MQDLGTLGGPHAWPSDVNADGSVVVGYSRISFANTDLQAFRWTTSGGMQGLGILGGGTGNAYSVPAAVNDDGTVVVGSADSASGHDRAFRWTAATGMQDLGPGWAVDVSADGSVVVGNTSPTQAFRWTAATGVQVLGTLGGPFATATAVSADGSTVIGQSVLPSNVGSGFTWNAATGMRPLGGYGNDLADLSSDGSIVVGTGGTSLYPRILRWVGTSGQDLGPGTGIALSRDGTVAVGDLNVTFATTHAFRWSGMTGMLDLGTLGGGPGGAESHAYDVSDDGSTVVGTTTTSGNYFRAFRWTSATGLEDLGTLGGTISQAICCSADGTVVIGTSDALNGHGRVFRWQLGARPSIGESYCATAVANSTGFVGRIVANGSNAASANFVQLVVDRLPISVFGYCITSRDQGHTYPVGNSQGVLCLGGNIGRYVGAGQVMSTGLSGSFAIQIDLGAMPHPFGNVAVQPGEVWNFQAWHRDANPSSTSNFTDAVSVIWR